jgi:hypothetical protein
LGLIDEIRDHEEQPLNEIVLPLLNISRRLPDGTVNEKEPNQQVVCATSAGSKLSFAYSKLIDNFENSIINPEDSFVIGFDYRIPIMHGLLDKNFINKLKMSPSYNEQSFATEYMSYWAGATQESWFNFARMDKNRKLKNPETHQKIIKGSNHFYLISMDVGRLNDQSVVCVFRVNTVNGHYHASLVNLYVLGRTSETKPFSRQAADLKKIIKAFNPREVVIDINGLGIGLGDEMISTQYDTDGTELPPYGFINDEEYKKVQPKDCQKILYGVKANQGLNSSIHGNTYARINAGLVHFLIDEKEAKSALLSTKIGQKMTLEKRIERLMPHEMTTKLFDEMANLRLKRTGNSSDIVLEQINSRFPKDKYSAFSYGLWRIKELEDMQLKVDLKRNSSKRQLVFYSEGD